MIFKNTHIYPKNTYKMAQQDKQNKGLKAVLTVVGVLFAFLIVALPLTVQALHANLFASLDIVKLFSTEPIEVLDEGQPETTVIDGEHVDHTSADDASKEHEDDMIHVQQGEVDLVIKDMRLENQILTFDVGNQGDADLEEPVHFYIWIDGNLKWTYLTKTWANQDFARSMGHSRVQPQRLEGEHHVRACIDANNVVDERDEGNNCLERKLGEPEAVDMTEEHKGDDGAQHADEHDKKDDYRNADETQKEHYDKPEVEHGESCRDKVIEIAKRKGIDAFSPDLTEEEKEMLKRLTKEVCDKDGDRDGDRPHRDRDFEEKDQRDRGDYDDRRKKRDFDKDARDRYDDDDDGEDEDEFEYERERDRGHNRGFGDRLHDGKKEEFSCKEKVIEAAEHQGIDVLGGNLTEDEMAVVRSISERYCGEMERDKGDHDRRDRKRGDRDSGEKERHDRGTTGFVTPYEGGVEDGGYDDDFYGDPGPVDGYGDDFGDYGSHDEGQKHGKDDHGKERFTHMQEDMERTLHEVKREYEILQKEVERMDEKSEFTYVLGELKQLVSEIEDLQGEFKRTLKKCESLHDSDDDSFQDCELELEKLSVKQSLVQVKMSTARINAEVKEFARHAKEYQEEAARAGVTPESKVGDTLAKVQKAVTELVNMKNELVSLAGTVDASGDYSVVDQYWQTQDGFWSAMDDIHRSHFWDVLGPELWEGLHGKRVEDYHEDGFKDVREDVAEGEKWVKSLQAEGKDVGRLPELIKAAYELIGAGEKAADEGDFDRVEKVWDKMDSLGDAFFKEMERLGLESPFEDHDEGEYEEEGRDRDRSRDRRDRGGRAKKHDKGAETLGFVVDEKEQFKKHHSAGNDTEVVKMIDELSGDDAKVMLKKLLAAKEVSVEEFTKLRDLKGVNKDVLERTGKNVKDFDKFVERKKELVAEGEVLFEKLEKNRDVRNELARIQELVYSYNFSDDVNEQVKAKMQDFILRYEKGDIESDDIRNLRSYLEKMKEQSRIEKHRNGEIEFKDADDDQWYYEYAKAMKERGAMTGNPNGTMAPASNTNAAELAKLVSELALDGGADGVAGEWYEKYFAKLQRKGIEMGVQPGDLATRGLVMRIAFEAFAPSTDGVSDRQVFSDVPTSHPSFKAIAWAVHNDIVDSSNDTFRVDDPINRAELTKILKKMIEVTEAADFSVADL